MTPRVDLQAEGDRDRRERLLADHTVTTAIERLTKKGLGEGARRHLLVTATRLTAELAPDVHGIIDGCRTTLGVEGPREIFVYPEPRFNAAAVKPEKGRLLLMVSSSLLEAFEPDKLRFVAGHEVGHYLFDHHAILTGALLGGGSRVWRRSSRSSSSPGSAMRKSPPTGPGWSAPADWSRRHVVCSSFPPGSGVTACGSALRSSWRRWATSGVRRKR